MTQVVTESVRIVRETTTVPVSAIVPTQNRTRILERMLESLRVQGLLPAELIVIDASSDDSTRIIVENFAAQVHGVGCRVLWRSATKMGAAVQRNQAAALVTQPVVGFFDDDIVFESDCIARLWRALQSAPGIGGVNAMITNEYYTPPGRVSRFLFRMLAGERRESYAGRVIGPAVNLLPENGDHLPEIVPVEWLNTTCTLYRREALNDPPFSDFFTGYSLFEDLSLSLAVARHWKLLNARTARIFHDSQPGQHKNDPAALAKMQLVNRHFVMARVMGRRRASDYAKLAVWELFQLLVAAIQQRGGRAFRRMLKGKIQGMWEIMRTRSVVP